MGRRRRHAAEGLRRVETVDPERVGGERDRRPAIWAVDERCMLVPPTTSKVCSSPKRCWYWSVFSKLQLKVSDSPRLPSPPLLSPGRTVEGE